MCARGNEDLFNELLELFAGEADDHLKALSQKVLELENTADGGQDRVVEEILRHAHTLKGAAAAVDHDEIGTLMHHFEGVFERIRDGGLIAEPSTLDVAYQTLDVVASLAGLAATGPHERVDVSTLTGALESLSRAGQQDSPPSSTGSETFPPGPTPRQNATSVSDASATEARPPAGPSQPEETIRIATSKLDSIMAQVGELLVVSSGTHQNIEVLRQLAQSLARWSEEWHGLRSSYRDLLVAAEGTGNGAVADTDRWRETVNGVQSLLERGESRVKSEHALALGVLRALKADARVMAQSVNGLQNEVRRARMLPVSTIFEAFPRMVRDLAREQNKKVLLQIGGSDTEVDRAVLEQLKAPLTHLLRNCVDHGLEVPAVRRAAGKPEEGTITLEASQQGSTVVIRVADDGAGIDTEAVTAKASERGLIDPEEAAGLSRRVALQLIFRSGLSTSPILTDISGRGVGLDVVRENVEQLHGTVSVESEPARGTVFSLTLPLTVVTTKCLLVRVADRKLALPISGVARAVRVHDENIERVNGREAISVEEEPVRLARLDGVLGIAHDAEDHSRQLPAVVVEGTDGSVALVADELLLTQDVVVKPLPRPLGRVPGIAGASILGSGEIVLVLNAAELGRGLDQVASTVMRPAVSETEAAPTVVLLVDDSITTRTLEKNILESAGYQVRAASDGAEAWMLLQSEGADIAVLDVQMPRMDGFELTERIRNDERFAHLPVVLVTSLDSAGDRERGIRAGADAYITKGAFDQEQLLDTIRRLS